MNITPDKNSYLLPLRIHRTVLEECIEDVQQQWACGYSQVVEIIHQHGEYLTVLVWMSDSYPFIQGNMRERWTGKRWPDEPIAALVPPPAPPEPAPLQVIREDHVPPAPKTDPTRRRHWWDWWGGLGR